jgi:hypothetical protein
MDCPYRREHEWEWEQAAQGWRCHHCYALTPARPPRPLVQPPTGETESDKPTPAHPFPGLK